MDPSPCDGAIVLSILPKLADQSAIDWSKPLAEWSREEMAGFVGLAWRLIDEARAALDQDVLPESCTDRQRSSRMTIPF